MVTVRGRSSVWQRGISTRPESTYRCGKFSFVSASVSSLGWYKYRGRAEIEEIKRTEDLDLAAGFNCPFGFLRELCIRVEDKPLGF